MYRAIAATLLCVFACVPAVVHALPGVREKTGADVITFDDCKGAGFGSVEFTDEGIANPDTPRTYQDPNGLTGECGWLVVCNKWEAEEDGHAKSKLLIHPGCTTGNEPGGNTRIVVNSDSISDTSSVKTELTCVDCGKGQCTVSLIQRTKHELRMTYGQTAPDLNICPQWDLTLSSQCINGRIFTSVLTGVWDPTLSGGQGELVIGATGGVYNPSTGRTNAVVISVYDTANPYGWTDYLGAWAGTLPVGYMNWGDWDTRVDAVVEYGIEYAFACDGSKVALTPFSSHAAWNASLEDRISPQPNPVDMTNFGLFDLFATYRTLIYLYDISVTKNCDDTSDSCPCTQYTDPTAEQP